MDSIWVSPELMGLKLSELIFVSHGPRILHHDTTIYEG